MRDYDVLVIGAGMSGLAAGIRLAQFGKRVCIVDRQARPGGMNTYFRRRGRIVETGLHALTNWPGNSGATSPWRKILRQLRINEAQLATAPQTNSQVIFGDTSLSFTNDLSILLEGLSHFGDGQSIWRFVTKALLPYEAWDRSEGFVSARQVLAEFIPRPDLRELIFLPVAAFGACTEDDMPFGIFSMLFRSIFMEGLFRPQGGIKALLDLLIRRLTEAGAELKLRTQVVGLRHSQGKIQSGLLASGEEIAANYFVSTIGWPETWALMSSGGEPSGKSQPPLVGKISFVEVIAELTRPPAEYGFRDSLAFYCTTPAVRFRRPASLLEPRLGVICGPGNFAYRTEVPGAVRDTVRLTCLGAFDHWQKLSPARYQDEKAKAAEALLQMAARLGWDFRSGVADLEVTTPLTLARFTGRLEGAVYGSPHKCWDGRTPFSNLFVAGTDQGLPGVVGALLSGILIVNRYLLRE